MHDSLCMVGDLTIPHPHGVYSNLYKSTALSSWAEQGKQYNCIGTAATPQ